MFVFEETYYLIDRNDKVSNVKNKTNITLKALNPEDQEMAKQIIRDRKLDLGREDHLVIFFTDLNKG